MKPSTNFVAIPQVSVKAVIKRGERIITYSCLAIITFSFFCSILLPILGLSFWCLLFFPFGIVLCLLYRIVAFFFWSSWSFRVVCNVHQLQRSAELAGFLRRGDYERSHPRFSEPDSFVDDYSIPAVTKINENSLFGLGRRAALTLNIMGIHFHGKGFFPWNEVENERIARVGFKHVTGEGITWRSSHDYFRFESKDYCFEIPISSLRITAWELDLLLYIYRKRFSLGTSVEELTC